PLPIYARAYGSWVLESDSEAKAPRTTPVRDHYRVMWRAMAANTGERTLVPAVFPPGSAHVDLVCSFGFPGVSRESFVLVAASMSTLLGDYLIWSIVWKHMRYTEGGRTPVHHEL